MLERSASGMTIALRPGSDLIEPIEIVLGEVPLFVAAGHEVVTRMAERASRVRLAAGEWLFRAGERADSLYVVASGRVEAVLDDEEHTVVRTLARGDVIGELALLTGAPRAASVRARRDAELVRLASDEMAALLREQPEAALALTRALSQQLQESQAREVEAPPVPSTIAIVPLHPDVPVQELRNLVVAELARAGRVVQLDGSGASDDAERGRLLDRVEPDHEQVLLIAPGPDESDPWTAFCLRQADRVVCVAGPASSPWDAPWLPRLRGADLAFCATDPQATGIAAWTEALVPARRYLLRCGDGLARGAERMARRLSGRSVGLVLSGGGARGSAHLGVIEELLAAGVEIDRIGGTSMGALVGGLIAAGLSVDEAAQAMAR